MVKALLCDLDGTLIDSETYYMDGTTKYMKALGYDKDDKLLYQIIGHEISKIYDILESLLDYKVDRSIIEETNDRYFKLENPINYPDIIFKDVRSGLFKLKNKGIKLALCSQSSMKLLKKFIQSCELEGVFDCVISGSDLARPKPFPDIYLMALEALDVKKEEAIVYEDSHLGIKAGKAALITTVARTDNIFGLNQQEADLKVNSLTELIKWLEDKESEK